MLVKGEAQVDYGQILVESEAWSEFDPYRAFAGQEGVGLCGGGTKGQLLVLTGLRIGGVGFTVELHDDRPAADETWEEIVEVPFRPVSAETKLRQWNGRASWEPGLEERDYRVRYCATAMDDGRGKDVREDDEPQTGDRYLLQFWPASQEPARLLKQTSRTAASWHRVATSPVG
ncbi:hypothetical protein ABZT03_06830 [Streptomyces sp. NPDC005574]|uniref:hypothetical protein n=1 Tax=Streptomyces sp. NPDC005574 TaxID=3156891 RepID=UPI0033BC7BF8